jgi:hypothetical protein
LTLASLLLVVAGGDSFHFLMMSMPLTQQEIAAAQKYYADAYKEAWN